MKNRILLLLIVISILTAIIGYFIIPNTFNRYSDLVTYVSIMIAGNTAMFSLLFTSRFKRLLFNMKDKSYITQLHRIKSYFKASFIFDNFSIFLLFIIPDHLNLNLVFIQVQKNIIVLPTIAGSLFLTYYIFKTMLDLFSFPTNE